VSGGPEPPGGELAVVREAARALALEAGCGSLDREGLDLLMERVRRLDCPATRAAVSRFATDLEAVPVPKERLRQLGAQLLDDLPEGR